MPQIQMTFDKFLSKMSEKIAGMKKPTPTDLEPLLKEVYVQGGHEALYRADERRLREFYAASVEHIGGVQVVADRSGVSAETVENWIADPMGMRMSEVRRLEMATEVHVVRTVVPIEEGQS